MMSHINVGSGTSPGKVQMSPGTAIDNFSKSGDIAFETSGSIAETQFKHSKAETARQLDEERWIQAYRNYRGLYGPDVQFTSTEKSRVFVKVTKTKVLAAYGQIAEVLFGGNKFPVTIDPTTLPEGVPDTVNFESNDEITKAKTLTYIKVIV